MKKHWIALLLLAGLSVGCLEKETTQTLYLESDGSVTWEVLEQNVFSSSDRIEDRDREEAEYLERARSGRPEIALALAQIGGTGVETRLLRERRPFRLEATARFHDLERALSGLFAAAEIDAQVTLEHTGKETILTIAPANLELNLDDDDDPVLELLRSDALRFVISAGTFLSGQGFSVEDNGRIAMLTGAGDHDATALERYRLVWTSEE